MPKLLHVSASFLAGDPAASSSSCAKSGWVEGIAGWRSDLAVERHAGFQRDQRQSSKDEPSERFIHSASFCFEQAGFNGNSGCAKLFESLSRNFGIWVFHRCHYTLDARSNQRVSAWRRAALMAMRFKVEIDGAAACARSSLLKRQNFGVLQAVKGIKAFAHDLAGAVCNDRADASARRRKTAAPERKLQCPAHESFVLLRKCHDFYDGQS